MLEQQITLAPAESKVVSFQVTPREARTYHVSVNGLTGNFVAMLPPLDAMFVIAYAWWEDLPSWSQILLHNRWPANTAILTRWKVENTGNEAASLTVEFWGQSGSISLNPGESDYIEFTVNTGAPGSYSYTANLYANGLPVDSSTIEIIVEALLVPYPAAEVVSWYWVVWDGSQWVRQDPNPSIPTRTPFGMMITIRSLSTSTFSIWAKADCVNGTFSKSAWKLGDLLPGETKEFFYHLMPDIEFTTTDTVIVTLMDKDWNTLDTIEAPFSIV